MKVKKEGGNVNLIRKPRRNEIKGSSGGNFGIRLNLVMRFFLGEIELQKYYLAQSRW
jgi:hypothetical protein